MIYAVNKRTKEHRRIAWDDENMDDEWRAVQATPDGWIEWHGGECPLPAGDGRCEIRDRMGRELRATPRKVSWGHVGNAFDAIAYRPILEDQEPEAPMPEQGTDTTTPRRPFLDSGRMWSTKTETPAWDGEGLPPVGCECEYNIENHPMEEWRHAIIVGHYANRAVFCMPGDKVALSEDGFPRFFRSGAREDFRPLRSAEDRAVEEMAHAIKRHTEGLFDDEPNQLARALYRAGYRKTGGE